MYALLGSFEQRRRLDLDWTRSHHETLKTTTTSTSSISIPLLRLASTLMQGAPSYSRRSGPPPSSGRPNLARGNSFQRPLVTSGPTPPSLVHSHYLEDPRSVFNGGAGWRHARNNQLTPPNEHDKLCLLDTVPMSSRSSSSSSSGSAVNETGQLVPASDRRYPNAGASGSGSGGSAPR
ncbi:hypothetical protein DL93DRAFT_2072427 [Clavulina sp. PMI_390]|nr:hypothetical protein DL93DRAFT_2072427 [Clavulina sp. PMI_390]